MLIFQLHLPHVIPNSMQALSALSHSEIIKVGVAYVNIHVSRHLKQELAWAIDKWFWVVFKNSYTTKNLMKTILIYIVCIAM